MSKTCTRKGCGKSFDKPDESECWYHPGPPVFHDALKGWSCCEKRVISFDEFLALPGCTKGIHTTEVAAPAPAPVSETKLDKPTTIDENGVETYGNAPAIGPGSEPVARPESPRAIIPSKETLNDVTKKLDIASLEDPDDVVIPIGAKCKKNGCNVKFDGTNRDSCTFHPGTAIFHDASKGWSCCKRRVLEFDEFLKIPGCKTGRHLYVGPIENETKKQEEESVECRTDFYQTPTTVIVSIFAKKCDESKSSIEFFEDSLLLDLLHLGTKRFKTQFQLYGPIVPDKSKYKVMGTKVEITLTKANGLSWAGLRAGESGAGMIRFGVSGRTGTIGGKEIVYRDQS
ncbi:HSP20-like chaperone [Lipomyces orientalis]|uniref:HSP20-like chaperone n=1 Tax=Lipomyces orientalis TaxID=1233043 RepID=A0ACC3TVY9_9ASCO